MTDEVTPPGFEFEVGTGLQAFIVCGLYDTDKRGPVWPSRAVNGERFVITCIKRKNHDGTTSVIPNVSVGLVITEHASEIRRKARQAYELLSSDCKSPGFHEK